MNTQTAGRWVWAAVAAALFLRCWGLGFGMYYPDEHIVVNHALSIGSGDLNPHMFYYPSLFLYLLFAAYGAFFVLGHALGKFAGSEDLLRLFLTDPHVFYMIGRALSVLLGTATVWVVYRLGRQTAGRAAGVLAAIFLAVNYLHGRDSHYVTVDIAVTFCVTASLYFAAKYSDKARSRDYFFSLALAGAGAAVKYVPLLLAAPLGALRLWVLRRASRPLSPGVWVREAVLSVLVVGTVFFVCSPFVLIDHATALKHLAEQQEVNRGLAALCGPLHHMRMLKNALGVPLFAAALAGFVLALYRPNPKRLLLAACAAGYYAFITVSGQHFIRYVLPLVPLAAVFAADFVVCCGERLQSVSSRAARAAFTAGAAVMLCAIPLAGLVQSDILFCRKDTRDLARDWLDAHAAAGSTVALTNSEMSPRLFASKEQIGEKIGVWKASGGSGAQGKRLEALFSLDPYPAHNYRLYYLDGASPRAYAMHGPFLKMDADALVHAGVRYVVANYVDMARHPGFFYRLRKVSRVAVTIDPRRDPKRPMSASIFSFVPDDASRFNLDRTGPVQVIFEIGPSGDAA